MPLSILCFFFSITSYILCLHTHFFLILHRRLIHLLSRLNLFVFVVSSFRAPAPPPPPPPPPHIFPHHIFHVPSYCCCWLFFFFFALHPLTIRPLFKITPLFEFERAFFFLPFLFFNLSGWLVNLKKPCRFHVYAE